ncbi:hypothetical protein [Lacihabitans soyangensis]|uniref:Uncharacterized protein n=1 Tax=Lacihabitans soyangensis TaxID=869394 RepID=A0AAE3H586_9BACT|nr:hypothetical protein [Lacihabitans soyangensis]MCP9763807.1 hypothetical protein [Lacihabitans soyangensis]MCP9764236.1 hypothetical protein [Lacihabitans soyangensis]MCP9764960.1 hypothetical protein [Lacihabitans soyangensis]
MPLLDFSNLAADAVQEDNIAGNLAWFGVISAKAFSGEYPAVADVTAGEITGSPVARLGAHEFAKVEVPQNSVVFDSDDNGPSAGHNNIDHMLKAKLAGMSKEVQAELKKYKNNPCVFIVPGSDGRHYLVGSSNHGIILRGKGKSGGVGTDERGFDLEGKSSGHRDHPLPISAATLALIPWV